MYTPPAKSSLIRNFGQILQILLFLCVFQPNLKSKEIKKYILPSNLFGVCCCP